jgi:hypothetical protein
MEKTRIIVSDVYILDMNSKKETRIHDELTIGREGCGLEFPKDTVISRRHLRIVPADDVVMVEDLGSRNNTLVNGKMLRPNVLYKLKSRDVIEFGQQKYQIIIGGKIASFPQKGKKDPAEVTAVFSKLMLSPAKAKAKKSGGRDLDSLEDFSTMDTVPNFEESEVALAKLMNDRGVGWFLQFDGSEFGPLSHKEMKVVVSSQKFQGGELFIWAEGLPTWTLIDKNHKIFGGPPTTQTGTKSSWRPVPLVAMITWFVPGKAAKKKITATCESISLEDISIVCAEKISDTSPFEIEVSPRKGLGVERFQLKVKFDPNRISKKGYTLEIISMTSKTKMVLERFIREGNT